MNARFWVWWAGDWVKITLRPRQGFGVHRWRPTDEGWDSIGCRWTLGRDGIVTRETFAAGRDCDGGLSRADDDYCHVHCLRDAEGHDGTRIPAWIDAGSECRDEYAEAAGY